MREKGAKEMSREATAREAIEKNRHVRVFGGKKVKGDDPVEYFLPTEIRSIFLVADGWWQLKFRRMNRFLEEKRMKGEKESVLLSVGEEQIWGA